MGVLLLGGGMVVFGSGFFFCLIVCFYFSWEELSLRVMKLWGKERRLQMISTSRLAGQLLPSPWRQSRIISNACWCSNTSVFPVWSRGWKKRVCRVLQSNLSHPPSSCYFWICICYTWGWTIDRKIMHRKVTRKGCCPAGCSDSQL